MSDLGTFNTFVEITTQPADADTATVGGVVFTFDGNHNKWQIGDGTGGKAAFLGAYSGGGGGGPGATGTLIGSAKGSDAGGGSVVLEADKWYQARATNDNDGNPFTCGYTGQLAVFSDGSGRGSKTANFNPQMTQSDYAWFYASTGGTLSIVQNKGALEITEYS